MLLVTFDRASVAVLWQASGLAEVEQLRRRSVEDQLRVIRVMPAATLAVRQMRDLAMRITSMKLEIFVRVGALGDDAGYAESLPIVSAVLREGSAITRIFNGNGYSGATAVIIYLGIQSDRYFACIHPWSTPGHPIGTGLYPIIYCTKKHQRMLALLISISPHPP
jgi:hypothetical protein